MKRIFVIFVFLTCLTLQALGQETQTLNVADNGDSPWAVPAGAFDLVIEVWGAGGSGGGHGWSQDGSSGAGGGAYSKLTIANPTGSYDFYVGEGGAAISNANGEDGEDSWFKSNDAAGCVAKGGKKGLRATGPGDPGGAGGLASEGYGDVKYDGGWGEYGRNSVTGKGGWGGSSAGTGSDGYYDGSSPWWSTEIYPVANTPAGAGVGGDGGGLSQNGKAPASGNGGGGGGAGENIHSGGAGADGKIVLTWQVRAGGHKGLLLGIGN